MASPNGVFSMADPIIAKITMFFQGNTQQQGKGGAPARAFGWSESFYFPGTVDTAIATLSGAGRGKLAARGLATARAALLPKQAGIVAVRGQQVSPQPPGPSTTIDYLVEGGDQETDMPQISLLIGLPGVGVTNIRRQIIRCIPDIQVEDGEYTPKNGFDKLVQNFIDLLDGWNFKGKDRGAAKVPVISIDGTGLVTTSQDHGLAIGDNVSVGKGRTLAFRNSFSGSFKVLTTPTARTLTLTPYNTPVVVQGGYIRKVTPVYPSINVAKAFVERSVTRKTGRPFAVFHGRQGRKH
jgi:hypothetical protein